MKLGNEREGIGSWACALCALELKWVKERVKWVKERVVTVHCLLNCTVTLTSMHHTFVKIMHVYQSSAVIVTWCLCDACGDLSQICASKFPLSVLVYRPATSLVTRISNLCDPLSNCRKFDDL